MRFHKGVWREKKFVDLYHKLYIKTFEFFFAREYIHEF